MPFHRLILWLLGEHACIGACRTAGSPCRNSLRFTSCTVPFSNSVSAWAGFWPPHTQWVCYSLSFVYSSICWGNPEIRVHENICLALLYRNGMYWWDTVTSEKYQSKTINLSFRMQTLDLGISSAWKTEMQTIDARDWCTLCPAFLFSSLWFPSSGFYRLVSEYRVKCTIILSLLNITSVVH